jgi:hypothetical protein
VICRNNGKTDRKDSLLDWPDLLNKRFSLFLSEYSITQSLLVPGYQITVTVSDLRNRAVQGRTAINMPAEYPFELFATEFINSHTINHLLKNVPAGTARGAMRCHRYLDRKGAFEKRELQLIDHREAQSIRPKGDQSTYSCGGIDRAGQKLLPAPRTTEVCQDLQHSLSR